MHPLLLAHLAAQLSALLIEHVAQEPGPTHDPGHAGLVTKAHALGELVSDEAASHHKHSLRRVGFLDDRVRVVEGLEAQTGGDVRGTRPGRRFRPAAGGDQDRVVLQLVAPVGLHDLLSQVDVRRPCLEMNLEILGRVLLRCTHEYLLAPHLAAEIARQRDTVVERMALGRDHHDRCVGIRLAQVLSAGLAGDAVPQDDVAPRHGK